MLRQFVEVEMLMLMVMALVLVMVLVMVMVMVTVILLLRWKKVAAMGDDGCGINCGTVLLA